MKKTYIEYEGKKIPFWVHDRLYTQHGTMDDFISLEIENRHQFFELSFLEHIKNSGEEYHSYLDIGANIGNHSVYMHEVMGIQDITCIEPYKVSFAVLEGNCPWAKLYNVGAGSEKGEMHAEMGFMKDMRENSGLYIGNAGGVSLKPGTGIDIITIDSLEIEPDLVKIDVEGMEVEVLKGMRKTLDLSHPDIWLEINTIDNVPKVMEQLPKGYVVTEAFDSGNPMFLLKCI